MRGGGEKGKKRNRYNVKEMNKREGDGGEEDKRVGIYNTDQCVTYHSDIWLYTGTGHTFHYG